MDWKEKINKIHKAEKEGVFVEVKGFEFKICAVNTDYANTLNELMKEKGLISAEHLKDEDVFSSFIEHLMKDWRGFEEEGKEIPFSIEKAKEILLTKDEEGNLIFDDFFTKLASFSISDKEFYKEAIIKNS